MMSQVRLIAVAGTATIQLVMVMFACTVIAEPVAGVNVIVTAWGLVVTPAQPAATLNWKVTGAVVEATV